MENIGQAKAVIYCRVSTKEQAEEGNSLITQERNCREYARKHNYEISRVFIEEGESAKTADRTELQKLLSFCSNRKESISAIIIYKIDRLSRNTDDYSQLRILLKRYGVEIKSTSEYFENTPAGRFMENIIANVAEFDNDVRTERSVGGMRDAVREGRYVWQAPIGYSNQRINGKASIVQNDKAAAVRKAFEMMADRKYSIDECRELLAGMGLTITGKPIVKSAFYKMIRNELYAGWITKFGERHKGTFEPIISEEIYTRVQVMISDKKVPKLYLKENPDFPLRGFITFSSSQKLTGSWSTGRSKKYAYYRFHGIKEYWKKDYLERKFEDFMDEFSFDLGLIEKLRNVLLSKFSTKSAVKENNTSMLYSQKKQLKEKQDSLLNKNLSGIISDDLLKGQLARVDEEIWNIDKLLSRQAEKKVEIKKIIGFIVEYLRNPSKTWRRMPLKIKLQLQWFQFPCGVIFDGNKFRTAKVSSLFKLKDVLLTDMSSKVNHREQNYEHSFLAENPPFRSDDSIVWNEIVRELEFLDNLIHAPETPHQG